MTTLQLARSILATYGKHSPVNSTERLMVALARAVVRLSRNNERLKKELEGRA